MQDLRVMEWCEFKKSKMETLEWAKERCEVDEDVIPLLDLINSFDCFVTTSSCSGRIGVLDMPEFGDKVEAKFLGKWHEPVKFEDVLKAVKRGQRVVWLIMYPPIIHIACKDLSCAEMLMSIANNSGFRRSGIISVKNWVVEITSLERLEVPVALNGELILSENALRVMVDFANRKLAKSKEKLKRFYKALEELKV
ncbi:tRNA(Phe) 7-((3-amino-3-carboxypropyl)-4-demethylwyosine(37)-N(4))-methyltransferase [Archaeoglobus sp.]